MATVDDRIEMQDKLDADIREAARHLGQRQARTLVDLYYVIQEDRKRGSNQKRAADSNEKPNNTVDFVQKSMKKLEDNTRRILGEFTASFRVGQWLQGLTGIGDVISAGLLARLDIRRAPTVGHIWRYVGLDPTLKWHARRTTDEMVKTLIESDKVKKSEQLVTGQIERLAHAAGLRIDVVMRRLAFLQKVEEDQKVSAKPEEVAAALALLPWCAPLKRLLFIAGDCFVKFCNHPKQYYGTIYVERKEYEAKKNERGDYKEQARLALAEKNFDKSKDTYKFYEKGMLPPGRIHMRSMRYTVKMFLSHLHHVMHWDYHGEAPPKPFILAHDPVNHRHFRPVPNWNEAENINDYRGRSLRELYV